MGAVVLDASVVIALLDASDAHHARALDDVEAADRREQALMLPASAYSEMLVVFARAGRVAQARDAVSGMGIAIVPLTAEIAQAAAELRARHRHLRLPDALVLASGPAYNAEILSYDRRTDDRLP
jgi:predicted nucleic acid-binding protein